MTEDFIEQLDTLSDTLQDVHDQLQEIAGTSHLQSLVEDLVEEIKNLVT